jgi:hypothetical protein
MDMNICIFVIRKKFDIILLPTVTFEDKNRIRQVTYFF